MTYAARARGARIPSGKEFLPSVARATCAACFVVRAAPPTHVPRPTSLRGMVSARHCASIECIQGPKNKDFLAELEESNRATELACARASRATKSAGSAELARVVHPSRLSESLSFRRSIRCVRERVKAKRSGKHRSDCSCHDLAFKMGRFENHLYKQRLTMKIRSRLRVICATPRQKRAAPLSSKRFLCCVCMALR
jgi:hypothetical protein